MKLFIFGLAGFIVGAVLGYVLLPSDTRYVILGCEPYPIVFSGGDVECAHAPGEICDDLARTWTDTAPITGGIQ